MEKIKPVLLLADNREEYRRSLVSMLQLEDFEVLQAESVEKARDLLETNRIDLALIDLRLTNDDDINDISGLELAKLAQDHNVPRLIITAFATVEATRLTLKSRGADPPLAEDLIPKADGPHAILDAIRRILSLSNLRPDLDIDLAKALVRHAGQPLELSRQQYDLLSYMRKREGALCTVEELFKAVYNEDIPSNQITADKRLERLIARVREKIETKATDPRHLVNVQGRGYRLDIEG